MSTKPRYGWCPLCGSGAILNTRPDGLHIECVNCQPPDDELRGVPAVVVKVDRESRTVEVAAGCKDCGSTGAHYCVGKRINGIGNQQLVGSYKEWLGAKYDASGGPPTPEQFQETVDRIKNETGKDRRFEREYMGKWVGPMDQEFGWRRP